MASNAWGGSKEGRGVWVIVDSGVGVAVAVGMGVAVTDGDGMIVGVRVEVTWTGKVEVGSEVGIVLEGSTPIGTGLDKQPVETSITRVRPEMMRDRFCTFMIDLSLV